MVFVCVRELQNTATRFVQAIDAAANAEDKSRTLYTFPHCYIRTRAFLQPLGFFVHIFCTYFFCASYVRGFSVSDLADEDMRLKVMIF